MEKCDTLTDKGLEQLQELVKKFKEDMKNEVSWEPSFNPSQGSGLSAGTGLNTTQGMGLPLGEMRVQSLFKEEIEKK